MPALTFVHCWKDNFGLKLGRRIVRRRSVLLKSMFIFSKQRHLDRTYAAVSAPSCTTALASPHVSSSRIRRSYELMTDDDKDGGSNQHIRSYFAFGRTVHQVEEGTLIYAFSSPSANVIKQSWRSLTRTDWYIPIRACRNDQRADVGELDELLFLHLKNWSAFISS